MWRDCVPDAMFADRGYNFDKKKQNTMKAAVVADRPGSARSGTMHCDQGGCITEPPHATKASVPVSSTFATWRSSWTPATSDSAAITPAERDPAARRAGPSVARGGMRCSVPVPPTGPDVGQPLRGAEVPGVARAVWTRMPSLIGA